MKQPDFPEPEYLRPDMLAALRAWRRLAGSTADLLAYLLLVQEQRRMLVEGDPSNLRLATNRVLLAGIEMLEKQDEPGAHILRLRFLDDRTVLEVGHKLNLTEDEVKKRQRQAIEDLAGIVWRRESPMR
jgi:DNA-directed RNA polymerase specialized sigma24 family protein